MEMITSADVIRRIDMYLLGDALPRGQPPEGKAATITVAFRHGLGDCAYFAHMIPLYLRRGYRFDVECSADKAVLFKAAGANTIESGAKETHPWGYPSGRTHEGHARFWQGSKMGNNLSAPPLPNIGDKAELWDEYCASRIDIEPHLSVKAFTTVEQWFSRLPRPITLLHSKGNTAQERKSLPDGVAADFYRRFLDVCDGSLVLLDWDNRVPRLASYRIRHLDELGPCPTDELLAMLLRADLLVAVDSGPLHLARFTHIPTIGVWMPGHYPTTYSLPRREQLNIVLAEHTAQWNKFKRIPWNIVENTVLVYRAELLADYCQNMLSQPRFLKAADIDADVQLHASIRLPVVPRGRRKCAGRLLGTQP
jgi:hypothetical protein